MGILTEEQQRLYREQGYLVFEGVLSEQELGELRRASEKPEVVARRQALSAEGGLAVIQDILYYDDAFLRAAHHPFLLAAVQELIGPSIQMQHCKLNWKPRQEGGGEVGWHQDFPFFAHTNFDLLAAMFLLDDATPENGCMRVLPGSHRLGVADHWEGDRFTGRAQRLPAGLPEPVDLAVPAGSLTIHHCLTLHASYPNRSSTPRRGLIFQMRAADAVQLGGNLYRCNGLQLAGTDPLVARCVEGAFRIPMRWVNRVG